MLYLNNFIKNLETKGSSQYTTLNYELDLKKFYNYIISLEEFKGKNDREIYESILLLHLEEYVSYLKSNGGRNGNGEAPKTIIRRIASLKGFFKYLKKHNIITNNPCVDLDGVKVPKRNPVYLSQEESIELIKAAKKDHAGGRLTEHTTVRNELMIRIYVQYGLRNSELRLLKVGDIDTDTGAVKILGKGNKTRFVYLNQDEIMLYNNYMEIRNTLLDVKDDNIFLSNNGRTLSIVDIGRIIKSCVQETNIPSNKKDLITPHKLRHTAATNAFKRGFQLNEVSKLLGHESVEITDKIYLHISDEDMKKNCGKLAL